VELRIQQTIDCNNVCSFWNHIDKLQAGTLNSACKKFFCENLKTIMATSDFLQLDRALLLRVFYPKDESQRDASGLATYFSANSIPYRTLALTQWFAARQPNRLKRKLEECFPSLSSTKRKFWHEQRAG